MVRAIGKKKTKRQTSKKQKAKPVPKTTDEEDEDLELMSLDEDEDEEENVDEDDVEVDEAEMPVERRWTSQQRSLTCSFFFFPPAHPHADVLTAALHKLHVFSLLQFTFIYS